MTKKVAERIRYMIEKELCRDSLVELCDVWEVDIDDVKKYLQAGVDAANG